MRSVCWEKMRVVLITSFIILSCFFIQSFSFTANADDDIGRLYFDIDFESNFLFDKYDVELYVDGDLLSTLPHGEHYTKLIDGIATGDHTIAFFKAGNHDISNEQTVLVGSETTFRCTLRTHGSSIEIDELEIDNTVADAELSMPDLTYTLLPAALEELSETGFINVEYKASTDDSIITKENWTVISQSQSAGDTLDKNTQIILTCQKTQQLLDDSYLGKNIQQAAATSEKLGFQVTQKNSLTGEELKKTSYENEIEYWEVVKAEMDGNKNVILSFRFTGSRLMPDVVGLTYDQAELALQKNDFSNVRHASVDEAHVKNKENWTVINQNVDAGVVYPCLAAVIITVESTEDYQSDQALYEQNADTLSEFGGLEKAEISTEGAAETAADIAVETPAESASGDSTKIVIEASAESSSEKTDEPFSEKAAEETSEKITENDFAGMSDSEAATEIVTEITTEKDNEEILGLISIMSAESDAKPVYQDKELVTKVQQTLNESGFDCGTADGIAGTKTFHAIGLYQLSRKMDVTGNIDSTLCDAMGISYTTMEPVSASEFASRYNEAIHNMEDDIKASGIEEISDLNEQQVRNLQVVFSNKNVLYLDSSDGSGIRYGILEIKASEMNAMTVFQMAGIIYASDKNCDSTDTAISIVNTLLSKYKYNHYGIQYSLYKAVDELQFRFAL